MDQIIFNSKKPLPLRPILLITSILAIWSTIMEYALSSAIHYQLGFGDFSNFLLLSSAILMLLSATAFYKKKPAKIFALVTYGLVAFVFFIAICGDFFNFVSSYFDFLIDLFEFNVYPRQVLAFIKDALYISLDTIGLIALALLFISTLKPKVMKVFGKITLLLLVIYVALTAIKFVYFLLNGLAFLPLVICFGNYFTQVVAIAIALFMLILSLESKVEPKNDELYVNTEPVAGATKPSIEVPQTPHDIELLQFKLQNKIITPEEFKQAMSAYNNKENTNKNK